MTWGGPECPRLTAAMILSGSVVQGKGLGSWLIVARQRSA